MEDYDEGFARNVSRLFGNGGLFEGMNTHPLVGVVLSQDKEQICFSFSKGDPIFFGVEGDCCSHSWIEALEAPEKIKGRKIVSIEDIRVGQEDLNEYELRQFYQTIFRLDNGESIKLEYRNDSNGYYGGYLVRLDKDGNREW